MVYNLLTNIGLLPVEHLHWLPVFKLLAVARACVKWHGTGVGVTKPISSIPLFS